MRLRDLFGNDAAISPQADAIEIAGAIEVNGLAVDSRAVKPGDLFFALAGHKTDGSRFIESAIAAGAVAIAGEHSSSRQIRAARWRWPRRNFTRSNPRPSPPSPAPAARLRSRRLRARSGKRWDMPPPASAPSAWCRRTARSTAR
jgi:UDP-N-acetylmuramoyl-L-alanyl-D-glutamate--2,6-diaminopimelate ligase